METLELLIKKFDIKPEAKMPIEVQNFGRDKQAELFSELGFDRGAEIGVYKGENAEVLCQANPKLKLYAIDNWTFYPLYKNFKKQWQHDQYYKEATERLAKYNCEIVKKWSMDAVKDFEDESLDFVFIDGDHRFEYVTNDIAEWSKKVKIGGIVAGHDFGRSKTNTDFHHVQDVVEAWTFSHDIKPWFVLYEPGTTWGACWAWPKTKASI